MDQLEEAGVEHAVGGVIGGHGESIVGLAEKADADLVIVGGRHARPPVRRSSARLLRK